VLGTAAGRQSATAAVATKTSCCGASGSTASHICCALVHVDARHAARRGQRTGPATSVTARPPRRGAGDGKTHLAAGVVGDAAHRVDGLEGGPGRDQHAAAGQALGLEEGDQFVDAARTAPACGRRRSRRRPGRPRQAPAGTAPSATTWATLRCVAGCAHISRFIAGATSSGQRSRGPGQAQQAQQVVGPALGQLGDEVGAGRRDASASASRQV
jgi:hypothetical protein